MAVKKSGDTVGHLPRVISCVCSIFLRRGCSILCRVTGCRGYSSDLPQGGLEIPCKLIFSGKVADVSKAENCLMTALAASESPHK